MADDDDFRGYDGAPDFGGVKRVDFRDMQPMVVTEAEEEWMADHHYLPFMYQQGMKR